MSIFLLLNTKPFDAFTFSTLAICSSSSPWVGRCVGHYNHRYFYLFMCYLLFAALYFFVSGWCIFWKAFVKHDILDVCGERGFSYLLRLVYPTLLVFYTHRLYSSPFYAHRLYSSSMLAFSFIHSHLTLSVPVSSFLPTCYIWFLIQIPWPSTRWIVLFLFSFLLAGVIGLALAVLVAFHTYLILTGLSKSFLICLTIPCSPLHHHRSTNYYWILWESTPAEGRESAWWSMYDCWISHPYIILPYRIHSWQ